MVVSKLKFFCSAFAALSVVPLAMSQTVWTPTEGSVAEANPTAQHLINYSAFHADLSALRQQLAMAPRENLSLQIPGWEIQLPMPDGRLQRFKIQNSPVISGQALRQMPDFSSYIGYGVDDPYAMVRLDFSPTGGFHGQVLSPNGDVLIDPVSRTDLNNYITYYKRDYSLPRAFHCQTPEVKRQSMAFPVALTSLKTYRLAMNATIEYTNFHGGVSPATTAVGTAITRVTGVYEKDFGIRLNMTYVKCWSGADPYSNTNGSAMLTQNQTETDATVGNANYDIGHVFSTGGGGIAGLNVVGITGQKARGVTGLPSPIGDPFYIDYVAHEMGHQYGGNHTFHNCPGGSSPASARYEPGSASTIMGYAGICGAQDVQSFSDAYFHTHNFDEIMAWKNNPASGGTSQNTTNNNPTINAGNDFTIPTGTPFKLTGTGADQDGDPLTYCWEQFNLGPIGDDTTQPLFRSRNPSTSRTRFMPQLSTVINNGVDTWERLPPLNRSMTFRCTVRDNRVNGGGSAYDSMNVTVSGAPFLVTFPNSFVNWSGGTNQTITWTVGGGAAGSPNVNILLSTDGGNSYGNGTATVLLANTPNDGSQQITVPNINSAQCRIIVEAASSIYYDMSNANFTIVPGTVTVGPDAFTVLEGIHTGGGVAELQTSDDQYLTARRHKAPASGPHVQVQIDGTAPNPTASSIVINVENKVNFNGMVQTIEAFNWITNSWTLLDTIPAPTSDTTRTLTINSNAVQYIQAGTRKVRLKIGLLETTSNLPRWTTSIDRVSWGFNP